MKILPLSLLLSTLLTGALLAQEPAPASGSAQDPAGAEATQAVYVIVKVSKAAVLTLPDKKGPAVMRPAIGQLLRVEGPKRAAFLPVVAPGGFAVWVFGRNLKPTAEPGVLEVTANAINQRPMPSSEIKSYPLSRRLHGGDQVRVIARQDETKPLAEDWVQVWSSADSVGWILAEDCKQVVGDGDKMWADAMLELGSRTAAPRVEVAADGTDAPGTSPGAAPEQVVATRAQLALADELLAAQRAKETPDFGPVRAAYRKVLEAHASDELDAKATAGIELVTALEAAVALESDLEAARQRRIEDVLVRQKQLWEDSRRRDPLGGRFDARGVLERQSRAGEQPRYVLRWGPELVCEVRCASGRYELDRFCGYELGFKGKLSYSEPDALLADRPVLEVGRIIVLARR